MTKLKKVPNFKTEKEEREFWETHDSSEYLDLEKAERVVMPNLKGTSIHSRCKDWMAVIQAFKIGAWNQ